MQQDYYDKIKFLRLVFSSLIHDMRNPLSGISGYVQLIEQKAEDETISGYCKTVLDSLRNLQQINNDFLDILDGKSIELDKCTVSLSAVFNELKDKLSEIYQHSTIELSFDIHSDIKIFGDKEKLIKAFYNIFDNSREAMTEGGTLTVRVTSNGNNAEVVISDTGKGIPDSIRESIFKPFVTYEKPEAIGLGLAYTENIITGHKGTISVVSEFGRGTDFSIAIPLATKEV